MPRPPGIIDRVNFVVDFVQDPCEAPWQVYLETAQEPAGEMVLSLLTVGLDDIIRGYFRPSKSIGIGHGIFRRVRKSRRPQRKQVSRLQQLLGDDLGNIIGKVLPGASAVRARKVSRGVRVLWIIDSVIQRGLFYWLIADVVSEFLYDWTSLLHRTEFCQNSAAAACLYEGGTSSGDPDIAPTQTMVTGPRLKARNMEYAPEPVTGTIGVHAPAQIVASCKVHPFFSPETAVRLFLEDTDTRQRVIQSEWVSSTGPAVQAMMTGEIPSAGRYTVKFDTDRDQSETFEHKISVIGRA